MGDGDWGMAQGMDGAKFGHFKGLALVLSWHHFVVFLEGGLIPSASLVPQGDRGKRTCPSCPSITNMLHCPGHSCPGHGVFAPHTDPTNCDFLVVFVCWVGSRRVDSV